MTLRNVFKTSAILVITASTVIGPTATSSKPSSENKLENTRRSASAPKIHHGSGSLPDRVRDMRQWIIDAARSGDIEALGAVLESNELPPIVSFNGNPDPINFWKEKSRDGRGLDILAIMMKIFEMGYVKLHAGTSEEIYVWPYLAEVPLDRLTTAQKADLYQLLPPDHTEATLKEGRYSYYRAAISKDGTLQYLVADD